MKAKALPLSKKKKNNSAVWVEKCVELLTTVAGSVHKNLATLFHISVDDTTGSNDGGIFPVVAFDYLR